MSDLTVRYDNVYLYCERKQKASLVSNENYLLNEMIKIKI